MKLVAKFAAMTPERVSLLLTLCYFDYAETYALLLARLQNLLNL